MRTQLAAFVFVVWVSPLSSAVAQPAWLYGVDERELLPDRSEHRRDDARWQDS